MPASVPEGLTAWMRPFASTFTAAVWRHVLVLVAGALRAPGRRTVTAALRVMGLDQAPGFAVYHRVLSTGRGWARAVARRLLLLLVAALVPKRPIVVGLADTRERRWGAQISARGLYRDPVRSSHGHCVKPAPAKAGGQRPALAVRDAARPGALGRLRLGRLRLGQLRLGAAGPDRARAVCARRP